MIANKREKTFRTIVSFSTTTDAMAMEDYCTAHDVAGRFIPLPSVVSAGCGMCWSAPPEAEKAVRAAAAAAGITPEGIYQLLL